MPDPREKDHWRDLADLLGLPPDQNEPRKGSPSVAATSPSHEEEPDEEPAREREEALPEVEPVAEDTFAAAATEQPVDDEADYESAAPTEFSESIEILESELAEVDSDLSSDYAEVQETELAPPLEEEAPAGRPRRGRRRGRRGSAGGRQQAGRRAAQEDRADLSEDRDQDRSDEGSEPAPAHVGADEEEDRDSGRGARRGSAPSRERDFEDEEILDTDEVPQSEPADDEDQDDEEIDKLTDWNVPSWTELIGSLYRPDR